MLCSKRREIYQHIQCIRNFKSKAYRSPESRVYWGYFKKCISSPKDCSGCLYLTDLDQWQQRRSTCANRQNTLYEVTATVNTENVHDMSMRIVKLNLVLMKFYSKNPIRIPFLIGKERQLCALQIIDVSA